MFITIVACDRDNGIARDGVIPWRYKDDLEFFKNTTLNGVIIMGRKTFLSIGRALRDRVNCVITNDTEFEYVYDGIHTFTNPWDCVKYCLTQHKDKKLFVIGGKSIYEWFDQNRLVSEYYHTVIYASYECDLYYNPKNGYSRNAYDTNIIKQSDDYHIEHTVCINAEEQNMLFVMNELIQLPVREDRTGTGTHSGFGPQFVFNLQHRTFPLMTTRKMFFKGIFEELMMYLRGQTDSKLLEAKGVPVWSANTSRDFLDKRGLTDLPEGDMGHSYGFSFRHFGAQYKDCHTDYTNQGFDQLQYIIDELKNNPFSRRLIISLWEPNHMHRAALPPCLYNYQFYVREDNTTKYLSCMMTQRSSDFAVAGGWNVATGALLVYLLAYYTNMEPDQLIWNVGDIHIYHNLVDQVREQIERTPYMYPKIELINMPDNITQVERKNITLYGYRSHPAIKLIMSV